MIDFVKVEQSVKKLKDQVNNGEIDHQTFETRLVDMIDYAADGHYWMFGHKTRHWYRHDGTQWVLDDPGKLKKLTPSNGATGSNPQQSLTNLWASVNWGWFVGSLVLLLLVATLVYTSV